MMDPIGCYSRQTTLFPPICLPLLAAIFALAGCGGEEPGEKPGAEKETPPPTATPEGGTRITRLPSDAEQVFAALGRRCWAFETFGEPITYALRLSYRQGEKGKEEVVYEAKGDEIVRWLASVKAGGQPPESADGLVVVVIPHVPLRGNVPDEIETALVIGPFRRVIRKPASEVLPEVFRLAADADEGDRLRYGMASEGDVLVEEALQPGDTVRLIDYWIKFVPPGSAEAHWLHIDLTATVLEEGQIPEQREPLSAEVLAERQKERQKEAKEKKRSGHGGE